MRALPPLHPTPANLPPICVLGSASPPRWLLKPIQISLQAQSPSPALLPSPHPARCQGPAPLPSPQLAPPR